MTQNGEGNVIVVSSGKVLERKLKRSVHQSGGGERGKMGEGNTGWLSLASPGEGGRKERKQGEQWPLPGDLCVYISIIVIQLDYR